MSGKNKFGSGRGTIYLPVKTSWLVLLFSAAVGIILCEGGSRIWIAAVSSGNENDRVYEIYDEPGEYFGKHPGISKVVLDTYFGYAALPNSSGDGYATNSSGFRDFREFSAKPPENEIRIFVTGGSTCYGNGAPRHELTIGALLEKSLRNRFPEKHIVVINAAFPGYCMTQERIMIENRILDYNPDLVLLFTGFNDLVYAYDGVDTLRMQDHFTWRGRIERTVRTADGQTIPPEPMSTNYFFKVRYLLERFLWEQEVGERKNHLWTYTEKRTSLSRERFEEIIRRDLSIIGALSRDKGYAVIVALQPIFLETKKNLSNHEKKVLHDIREREGWVDFLRVHIPKLRRIMNHTAMKYGMTYTCLTDIFDQVEKPIFFDDCHFGDRGNRIVANRLTALMLKELQKTGF
ncbi:MAG: SGNH/GDSL hydrolase family protein [Deltaproteobacteria bacterium]|nr:SGNH/GDSL hydrolase family protein [Deltaproteobacteria bacterium]